MIPDRIEYLMMLARDERAENDSLIDKQNEVFAARAIRLLQLEEIHAESGRILQEEIKRFARWMPPERRAVQQNPQGRDYPPVPQDKIPRVVQQGPMPHVNPLMNMAKEK